MPDLGSIQFCSSVQRSATCRHFKNETLHLINSFGKNHIACFSAALLMEKLEAQNDFAVPGTLGNRCI